MVAPYISKATEHNWHRLGTIYSETRLRARANKTQSSKLIIPEESIDDRSNITLINNIVDHIISRDIPAVKAIYSLALNLIKRATTNDKGINAFLQTYHHIGEDTHLINLKLPDNECDLLGVIYQAISPEGRRNLKGQYYTPRCIVRRILNGVRSREEGYILDPCCGSGSFLCEAKVAHPSQLLGIDSDPMAVMITTVNLMLRYPKISFVPHVICADFLEDDLFSESRLWLAPYINQIVAIYTNPPWGANSKIKGEETFTQFIRLSIEILSSQGNLVLVLPDSFGKIKAHSSIRRLLLSQMTIHEVTYHPPIFSGVVTSCLFLSASKGNQFSNDVIIHRNGGFTQTKQKILLNSENSMLIAQDEVGAEIISTIKNQGCYYLDGSVWALGIVTGDNKHKTSTEKLGDEWHPICTGKDIVPYKLKRASKFVRYIRSELQQVAKEEIYNAPEKLVYKFISNTICFAYDNSGVLFLNSANILIPKIPNMGIKTVLGFLNSDLFRYLYSQLFDDIKILKGNLCLLPFPNISSEEDLLITRYVDAIINGDMKYHSYLQDKIFKIFGLSETHINHIHNKLHGNH